MANIKSAIRRIKVTARNHARNIDVKSNIKTNVKKARLAKDPAEAKTLFIAAQKALATAVSRGMIHKKQAARRTGRLAKKIGQLVKA